MHDRLKAIETNPKRMNAIIVVCPLIVAFGLATFLVFSDAPPSKGFASKTLLDPQFTSSITP